MASTSVEHGNPTDGRWPLVRPFGIVSGLAIIAGGLIAAAVAHDPSRPIVWMVAYLVLVVGAGQLALGIGRVMLAAPAPGRGRVALECALLNLGNLGVIAGTLWDRFSVVLAGELLFVVTLTLFLHGVRQARRGWTLTAYRGVSGVLLAGALVGLVLSAIR